MFQRNSHAFVRIVQRLKRSHVQPIVGFAICLIVIVWLAAWNQIETERFALQHENMQETANLTLVFEQSVARSIGEIDRLLLYLREAHERSGNVADWPSMIARRHTANEQTLQISVLNADGIVIASSIGPLPAKPIDLKDREHFTIHKTGNSDQLFISRPVVGRVSKTKSVQLSRRLNSNTGAFDGVIVVSLDPSHLSRAYDGIELGKGSGMALVGTDDVIRAGTGVYESELGHGLREALFGGAELSSRNGTSILLDSTNEQFRLMGSRQVPGYPLFVIVGGRDLAQDASFLGNKQKYLLASVVFTIIVLAAMLAAILGRWRHDRQIMHLARRDALTNLANRVKFREALNHSVQSTREARKFALHLIDLDRFKFVNDHYGHPVGDKLLKIVADRLRDNLRESDVIARLGGDEFAVIQLDIKDEAEATAAATRLCKVLSEIYEIDGTRIEIGASIGIAIAPRDADNATEIVKAADLALYTAKAEGRNCLRVYAASMNAVAQARRAFEADLETAIEEEQLEVHYQPILDITSSKITAYEALVRWRHPERGMIPPMDFIPLAEETGLIVPLGAWVLRKACNDMARRPGDIKVAVNFSPIQFKNPKLIDMVKEALGASGLAPHRLEVEITESTLMQKDGITIKLLQELHDLGVQIAMDDFGTGYSSLSYLQTYPIHCIKIDRSFVKTLGEKDSASAIIKAITALATSLGMSTIAEGVETREQLAELTLLGCTEAQGYLFSPPKPAAEILPKVEAIPVEAIPVAVDRLREVA